MADARAIEAARNNAEWCDAVCRSHGRPGRFEEAVWFNQHRTPRYYSNVITLLGPQRSEEHVQRVKDLLAGGLQGVWSVKDSFFAIDLAPLGFRVMFQAEWIYRPTSLPRPTRSQTGIHWARVENAVDLESWERVWDRELNVEETHVFLPTLFGEYDHVVIAGRQGQDIVAGCVASRSPGVVGMSNVFFPKWDAPSVLADNVAAVMDLVPGLPIVAYERGGVLAAARTLGFESVGPLRVWTRELVRG